MAAEIKNLKDIANYEYGLKKIFEDAEDFLPLLGTDYVEMYVGNAKQSALYYKTAFGFQSEAYAGLETGMKDRVSYVLRQDKIRLVLTTALKSDSPIGEHVKKHGDKGRFNRRAEKITKRICEFSFHITTLLQRKARIF